MQPESTPPIPFLPPITSLNLPPPILTQHSYTLYHQKKHMMLINGQSTFTSQNQQLSHRRKPNFQDYTTLSLCIQSQDHGPKIVDITKFRKCERCYNWIHQDEIREHMTFHGAVILDYLFLGDKFSAQSRKELVQRLKVTHVVNAASELPNSFISEGLKYYNLSLLDILDEDVITPCLKAAQFIETVFSEGGNVFVHCALGKSRSVAVILVYLMKYKALSLEDALALVKAKRHIVKPNPSYMKQLETFQIALKTSYTSTQAKLP